MMLKIKRLFKYLILYATFTLLVLDRLTANNAEAIDTNIIAINRNLDLINNNLNQENDIFLVLSHKTLKLSTKNKYHEGILKSYFFLGKIHSFKYNLDSAIFYFEAGIKEPSNNYDLKTRFLWEYAGLMWIKGNYATALENYLKIKELIDNRKTNLFRYQVYNGIGRCYESLLEYNLAIENFNKSLQLALEENDEAYTGLVLTNLGAIYYNQNDLSKALEFLNRGVKLEEKHKLYFNASFSYNTIADIYLTLNSLDSAKFNIEKAQKLSILSNEEIPIATTFLSYAKYYFNLKEVEKSKEYIKKLLALSSKTNYKDLLKDAYLLLSEIYACEDDFKDAYESFVMFYTLHSELYDVKEINKVKALEQKIIQREKEQELIEYELRKQKTINFLLIMIVLLVLVVGIIILIYLIQFKKLNKELQISKKKAEESDRLKSRFLQTISHEIRTPLNGIIGFSEMIRSKRLSDSELIQINEHILKNSDDLLSTIENLVDIAHLSTNQYVVRKSRFKLTSLLESVILQSKNHVVFKTNPDLEIQLINDSEFELYSDKNIIIKILLHLIKNAILYTEKGLIKVGYREEKSNIIFYVSDTGIGISNEKLNIIFSPFRQADEDVNIKMGGTGLGLTIINEFIQLLGGKIWVNSELKKGSTFSFSIPYK